MEHVGLIYDEAYLAHDTGDHPENGDRLRATLKRLGELNIYGSQQENYYHTIQPRVATKEELQWVHPAKFVQFVDQQVQKAKMSQKMLYLDGFGSYGETIASPGTYEASIKAVGGNFQGIDAIFNGEIKRSFVLCRPPGHHTNIMNARGFCVFNNIVLATEYLFRRKNLKRVAIIDFDAHAGNGTEEILDSMQMSGDVLCISMHQHPMSLYPGTCFPDDIGKGNQAGKTVNITFFPYSDHDCVQMAFRNIINPIVTQFAPEFILVSAGYDAHHADPVTAMGFQEQTYSYIMQEIIYLANQSAQGRIQCTLEGGYNLTAISNSIGNTLSVMAGEKGPCEEEWTIDNTESYNYLEGTLLPTLQEKFEPYWKF